MIKCKRIQNEGSLYVEHVAGMCPVCVTAADTHLALHGAPLDSATYPGFTRFAGPPANHAQALI